GSHEARIPPAVDTYACPKRGRWDQSVRNTNRKKGAEPPRWSSRLLEESVVSRTDRRPERRRFGHLKVELVPKRRGEFVDRGKCHLLFAGTGKNRQHAAAQRYVGISHS